MKTQQLTTESIIDRFSHIEIGNAEHKIFKTLREQFGAKGAIIVHPETLELISGRREFQLAREAGQEYVEAILWDIPKEWVYGLQILDIAKSLSMEHGWIEAEKCLTYFSSTKGGDGVKLRIMVEELECALAEFVAALFGMNRTYLHGWIELGKMGRTDLLRFVDLKESTLGAALKLAKEDARKSQMSIGNGSPKKRKGADPLEVTDMSEIEQDMIEAITKEIPAVLSPLSDLDQVPDNMYIEKVYQHNAKGKGAAQKLDHISITGEVHNFAFQVVIRPMDQAVAKQVAMPIPPAQDSEDEQYSIAA